MYSVVGPKDTFFVVRVRLLVNARTGASVALKTVRASDHEEAGANAAREAALHRALKHPQVLRCLGERKHGNLHYMFLEYAQGGELFDRIGWYLCFIVPILILWG